MLLAVKLSVPPAVLFPPLAACDQSAAVVERIVLSAIMRLAKPVVQLLVFASLAAVLTASLPNLLYDLLWLKAVETMGCLGSGSNSYFTLLGPVLWRQTDCVTVGLADGSWLRLRVDDTLG
mmetsp:Transcript_18145/g.43636  ORF Transcript_18145/g.43636 Transcript_18145/m.43636 type:complete len:121 (-) Transcript_18145:465-827(-)